MLTTLLLTVSATSIDKKAPTRFRIADRVTATFGFSAPVAIDVAMALPVSWKPLVKSNTSAVTTTINKMNRASVTNHSLLPAPPYCRHPRRVTYGSRRRTAASRSPRTA